MPKYRQNKKKQIADFFKQIARRPFVAFFPLLLVSAVLAVYVSYNFQQPSLSSGVNGSVPSEKTVFDAVKAENYRKIFLALEKRGKDYLQSSGSDYPDVFRSAEELTKIQK